LLNIKGKTYTVKLPYRPVTFRFTIVKPYYARSEKDFKNVFNKLTQTQPQITVLSSPAVTLLKQGRGRLHKYLFLTVITDIKVYIQENRTKDNT
jgi:hypothetical protein